MPLGNEFTFSVLTPCWMRSVCIIRPLRSYNVAVAGSWSLGVEIKIWSDAGLGKTV